MIVYKITDKDGFTRRNQEGETKWGENVTHKVRIKGKDLCSNQVIHCYKDPYLAVFMNPIHGDYDLKTMLLWEAETPKIYVDDGFKSGCKTLTIIKQIPIPKITTEQRVEIAIRCAMKVYDDNKFQDWAMKWINNEDRTAAASWAAAGAAAAAAGAAMAAAGAARAAAGAAAGAAMAAAWAAAAAASWAAEAVGREFDLIRIIHSVVIKKQE